MSNEHYDVGEISVIEVIRAKLTPEQLKGFYLGQVIKYSLRANHKDDFESDASKLADYARWLHELMYRATKTETGQGEEVRAAARKLRQARREQESREPANAIAENLE